MEKFSSPISKPADFGVSNQEVTEIVTRIRERGQSPTSHKTDPSGKSGGQGAGSALRAPRPPIF